MTTEEVIKEGFEIKNARITDVDLSMEDYGCLVFRMTLNGGGWGCCYDGSIALGHGFLGATSFSGSPKGIEYLMRIMDVVGVSHFEQLVGKYVRVGIDTSYSVCLIGNILDDYKWFDNKKFFTEGNELNDN